MDYLLENLGDERFQELCQSLLVKELKHVQCFPVGMPDGGRDAVQYITGPTNNDTEFAMYQVKFREKPQAEQDPHKWLVSVLEAEAPKLEAMIPNGATSFHLITNIPGTSHKDVGSIDKVNAILREHISVPAVCWWREDINRRLDVSFDLKWIYPDIMTGTDMLRVVFETGLQEAKESRTNAIRAFLRTQYKNDEEVKFKQIELQNSLVDLFVDVPISGIGRILRPEVYRRKAKSSIVRDGVGAAELLLSNATRLLASKIVVEGAPGQGKSTLAQYICQVHRILLLGEKDAEKLIPPSHRPSASKIPVKVDLRHFAGWLRKKNPFVPEEQSEAPHNWIKSLESFLAFQIQTLSGGLPFSTADLHAVLKVSAILLVLDGLDEVSDINERRDVVAEIVAGVSRLQDVAASLQVVVTSRPSVYDSSMGFPTKEYPHLHLLQLSQENVFQYSDKWSRARKMDAVDSNEVRAILSEKLKQPHLRDLAQNTMQLAILLTLINTKGHSLPDKRTALYDSYVDLFLTREAEKSKVVSEHRDLLIDLHRYIAWVLHSESEIHTGKGVLSDERLKRLLTDYLIEEQRPLNVVDDLLTGIIERVVFLVSRVQGTFEFEVQPLREYFAARHLYETAPYSPTGNEQHATKPDRFMAISLNPYWSNVTRFYAGCYSKGELPGLVNGLLDIQEKGFYRYTNHTRRLASRLLSDWVFNQDQRATKDAVRLVTKDLESRPPMTSIYPHFGTEEIIVLPKDCGRADLVNKCWEITSRGVSSSRLKEIGQIIHNNTEVDETRVRWLQNASHATSDKFVYFLRLGLHCGALNSLLYSELVELFRGKRVDDKIIDILLKAGRVDFLSSSEELLGELVSSCLDGRLTYSSDSQHPLHRFCTFTNVLFHLSAYQDFGNSTMYYRGNSNYVDHLPDEYSPTFRKCLDAVRVAEEIFRKNISHETEGWSALCDHLREEWGENQASLGIAVSTALRMPKTPLTERSKNVLDHSVPILERAYSARIRGNSQAFWSLNYKHISTAFDKLMFATSYAIFARGRAINNDCVAYLKILDDLSDNQFNLIFNILNARASNLDNIDAIASSLSSLSYRILATLGARLRPSKRDYIYKTIVKGYSGSDPNILGFIEHTTLPQLDNNRDIWTQYVRLSERRIAEDECSDMVLFYTLSGNTASSMPTTLAQRVLDRSDRYPLNIVKVAERHFEIESQKQIVPVTRMAKRDKWFVRPKLRQRI